jgi:hypothetical protein
VSTLVVVTVFVVSFELEVQHAVLVGGPFQTVNAAGEKAKQKAGSTFISRPPTQESIRKLRDRDGWSQEELFGICH